MLNDTLYLFYDKSEEKYIGSFIRYDSVTEQIVAYDNIETPYFDKILLFARINWDDEVNFLYYAAKQLIAEKVVIERRNFEHGFLHSS